MSRPPVNGPRPFERIQRHWLDLADDRFKTLALGEDRVSGLELRYGVRLPDDFREYLLFSAPADDMLTDPDFITWWPIERIKNIPDEYEHPIKSDIVARDASNYLFFADHGIWCFAWAIACGAQNRGRVVCIGGEDEFVADSFSEFIDKRIADFWTLIR